MPAFATHYIFLEEMRDSVEKEFGAISAESKNKKPKK